MVSIFVYRSNEYERRGYFEQTRFAKVAQGWTRDRYLRSVTLDLPRAVADAKFGPGALLSPVPPSEARYHADLFDSNSRLQVRK